MRLVAVLLVGCWTGSAPPAPAKTPPPSVEAPPPGSARLVYRTADGGVLELDGDRSAAMKDASAQMTDHCGDDNFTVVQEGEEAVGNDTVGGEVTISTAWRVHYQCNGSPGTLSP